jgi:hypothetical protein
MAKKEDRFVGGADGTEADFEDVAKIPLFVPFAVSAEAMGKIFNPRDRRVNCKPIFTWRFLEDKVAEVSLHPLTPAGGTRKDRFGVHACRL